MPATLPGNKVFEAGWESGTILRGSGASPPGFNGSSGSPTMDSNPPSGSGYTKAVRFDVDNTKYDGFGDRSEVQGSTNEVEGQLRWYRWSFYLPSSFPVLGTWQVFGQWHSSANGSPPLAFYSNDGVNFGLDFNLATGSSEPRNIVQYGRRVWNVSMASLKGRWNEIVMRIVWSASDSVASHRLWLNEVQQTFNGTYGNGQTEIFLRNTDPGRSHYYKQGYYRGHTSALNALSAYFSGFEIRDGAGGGTVTWSGSPPPPDPPPPTAPSAPPDAADVRFGASSATGVMNTSQANSIRGSAFSLAEPKSLTGYRVWCGGINTGSGSQPGKCLLYKVNSSNYEEDTIVAGSTSEESTIAFNAANAWKLYTVTTPIDVTAGTYRICFHTGTNEVSAYGFSDNSPMVWANDTYADGGASTYAGQSGGVDGTWTPGIAIYAIVAEPSVGSGALSGSINNSPAVDPLGFDRYFRGNLAPSTTSAVTRVAQIGQEVVSYRRPKFFEIKLDGTIGPEVVWNNSNLRFEYKDLQ